MRVARGSGLSTRVLLVAAVTLVFVGAPVTAIATPDPSCNIMRPDMQAGYRALEARQYADAEKSFTEANEMYSACLLYFALNAKADPVYLPEIANWRAYALAGQAAAAFGDGKTADGLKWARSAEDDFSNVIAGKDWGEGASPVMRRVASDGLAYVRALESAQKPLLPKVWLDWKAAHS